MISVAEILCQPGRVWSGNPPASKDDILRLRESSKIPLPQEYFDLLTFSNGGEGPLALPPLIFVLYSVDEAYEEIIDEDNKDLYPGYIFFGGNGGMEAIAFDVRGNPPWPIVMMDRIAGEESAIEIARDLAQFITAVGLEFSGDEKSMS
jgi:SMI1 / KNR4 family (SUKH-1)